VKRFRGNAAVPGRQPPDGAGESRYTEIRVYSRDPERRARFAARVQAEHGVACRAAGDAAAAVRGADIVVLATSSATPVIDAAWLAPGAYIATLGPKQAGRAEFDAALPAAAGVVVTDSLAQIDAYDPPNILAGTAQRGRLVSLGAVRAGQAGRTGAGGRAVFFSVGLAGTETFLLARLAASLGSS
jgi:ornithine cyclodeaminase/alanine dehydrogenase-like protein (mu-crystallin family)